MSRARVAVLQIVSKQLTATAAAAEYGISRRHLHRLLARYREGGLEALEPRSRRPKTTPIATPETVRQRVIELRGQLTADGLDAGPVTIAWHLEREGLPAPSTSTIRRILHAAGLITPEPRKRPRSSYLRFEMAQPNEMWQSDFIHWRLADGTDVEILNWLDDHSRYLISCTAHEPVTGDAVVAVFLDLVGEYGPPASTLTDNGSVYTSRFTGGRNAFEYVLPLLGIRQKNGTPGHPQTQGKTERFHQTLQRWLAVRPTARTIAELQQQLDQFREHYNERRPHRALNRRTPGQAYRATPKAVPASNGHAPGHYRLRYDRLDPKGKMSLRRAGRMHHLGVGTEHARKRVLALANDHQITVTDLTTGEVLSTHLIQPDKTYWRNQNKEPGRWPDSRR
jgi:transposase InsO family protein